jgi:biopolymer transport protein ExbD
MAFAAGARGGAKAEINVTPLVDVVLVLLIIFMVITPMLQRGKDVVLPKSHSIDEQKDSDPLILSMTKDKKVWVENAAVGEDELADKVKHILEGSPGKKVLLKGDQNLTVGDVRRIFPRLQQAGAHGVALGVEEIK